MRPISRLATAGALATLTIATAVGGASGTAATSAAAVTPTEITAAASGNYVCSKGLADCRSKRSYYQYLGCRTSPIYASWTPGFYYFTYRC